MIFFFFLPSDLFDHKVTYRTRSDGVPFSRGEIVLWCTRENGSDPLGGAGEENACAAGGNAKL